MSRKHSRAARRKRLSGAATAGRKPLSAQVSEREARLLRELEAERLENLRLRQTIDALQQASAPPAKDANELVPVRKKPRTRQEEWDASFREESRTAHGFSRRSYPRYLFDIVNASSPMRLIKKITLFFRRMRLVRLMGLDEGDSISAAISATVLLLPMYVIVLPIMLALTGLTAFSSLFFASRMNRRLRAELAGRHLYVFVVSDENSLKAGSFFCGNAHMLADQPDCAVLVVSPHNIGTDGLGGKGFYLTARQECPHLYIVRRHYFFNLRRRVLRQTDAHMTVVY